MWVGYGATIASVLILRYTEPDLRRPYKVSEPPHEKPIDVDFKQVQHKPGYAVTENSEKLEITIKRRRIVLSV